MAKPFKYIILEVLPMTFSEYVKTELLSIIDEMNGVSWMYSKNPEVNFTRTRKMNFKSILRFILSMESSSLKAELLKYFRFDETTPSASAFSQQRNKILTEAFQFLFYEFNSRFECKKSYKGYQLLACDGSDLNIFVNPKDKDTYFQSQPTDKGYNQIHLNALFDLCNKRYVDADIQPARNENEILSMTKMVDRYCGSEKTIFMADRGYESYNTFAHIKEKGMNYLIRVKDGTIGGITRSLELPSTDEFDYTFNMTLINRISAKQNNDDFYRLYKKNTFDYLSSDNHSYTLNLRVVRFAISDNSYETLITNLPQQSFETSEIKRLYAMRWGIETSFRELKYAIGLTCFHSKKVEYIKQEIYARMILYNYCEIITMHVVITKKDTKHVYQLNFTIAIHICRYFLQNDIDPPSVEILIQKNLLPIRAERSNPRKVKRKSVVSFLYRVS